MIRETLPRAQEEKRTRFQINIKGNKEELTSYEPSRWPTPESFTILNEDSELWGRYDSRLHTKIGQPQKNSGAQRNWLAQWNISTQENIDDIALDVSRNLQISESNHVQISAMYTKFSSITHSQQRTGQDISENKALVDLVSRKLDKIRAYVKKIRVTQAKYDSSEEEDNKKPQMKPPRKVIIQRRKGLSDDEEPVSQHKGTH